MNFKLFLIKNIWNLKTYTNYFVSKLKHKPSIHVYFVIPTQSSNCVGVALQFTKKNYIEINTYIAMLASFCFRVYFITYVLNLESFRS